tara:strand:+ start:455 stop:574 length:120 start_codon:yes stop_codon:yes gene_type:complete
MEIKVNKKTGKLSFWCVKARKIEEFTHHNIGYFSGFCRK